MFIGLLDHTADLPRLLSDWKGILDLISALSLDFVGESSLPGVSQPGSAAGLGSVWAMMENSH